MKRRIIVLAVVVIAVVSVAAVYGGWFRKDTGLQGSGTVEARMWTKFEIAAQEVAREDIVKAEARVELYRDRTQLAILQIRKARPEEIDVADYLPHTKEDVEKMWAQLLAHGQSIRNLWLQKLVLAILCDPAIGPRYKRAPAAKVMHHAYLGGLLEHVVGLCGLAKQVAATINRNLTWICC